MLPRNTFGKGPTAWNRPACAIALLALAGWGLAAAYALVRGAEPAPPAPPATDLYGDPLPKGALARLGSTRWRPGSPATYLAFTPDGKRLLKAGEDASLVLLDVTTGKEIRRFEPEQPKNSSVPGKTAPPPVAAMGMGWNQGISTGVALSQDGKTLAAALANNVIQLWNVASGKAVRQIPAPPAGLGALALSPDGKILAARAGDQSIHLWDSGTGKALRQIKGFRNVPVGVALGTNTPAYAGPVFSPSGKTLAAAEIGFGDQREATSLTLWETDTGKVIRRIPVNQPYGISTIAFAPTGKALAYGNGNTIQVVDTATAKVTSGIAGPRSGVAVLVISPAGKTLAMKGFSDRLVRLYDLATGKLLHQLGGEPAPPDNRAPAADWHVGTSGRDLAFSPSGKLLAAGDGSIVRLWDTATAKDLTGGYGHRGTVTALVMAPGGRRVGSEGNDGTVRLWEAATGREQHHFRAPAGTCRAAFAPDGRTVALGQRDGTLGLHDAVTSKELRRLKGHPGGVVALAFSPDGTILASLGSTDNTIRLHKVASGRQLRQLTRGPAGGGDSGNAGRPGGGSPATLELFLAFSADGRTLASGSPPGGPPGLTLSVWDVASGQERYRIPAPTHVVASYAFSPDGRTLATANMKRTVTLWEVASGKERARFGTAATPAPQPAGTYPLFGVGGGGAPAATPTVAFAPDGRTVIAPGPDWSVAVWDVVTGKELSRLKGHEGEVTVVALGADGRALASGSDDGTVLVWDLGRVRPEASPLPATLGASAVESLWADLSGKDAARAFLAVQQLAAAPGQAVPFLRARLRPVRAAEPSMLARLIAGLDSERFRERQQAMHALEKLGELAVPALERVLAGKPALETRRRAEQVLAKLTVLTLSPEQLLRVRAVEVLEHAGTAEAREVLAALVRGAPEALLTREAQAALDRLARGR
jgi:WD40 repeat protein